MAELLRCRIVIVTVCLGLGLVVSSSAVLLAKQDPDEKAIRDLVARLDVENRVPQTADSIFWSGPYRRPSIRGQGEPELTTAAQQAKRESLKMKTTIRRIEVSQSRDMAYEFSDGEGVARELDASGKIGDRTFTNSTLRVWKKVNGQWQVAASFARAHQQ